MFKLLRLTGLFVLFEFVLCNCSYSQLLFKDDELHLFRQSYNGEQLKIYGYFYQKKGDNYNTIYFLYENGIILAAGGGLSYSELINHESDFNDSTWIKIVQGIKYRCGIYYIEGDSIFFEKWYPSSGGPLQTFVREGKILNDTTFVISSSYRIKKQKRTELTSENEIYYFKEFVNKPDSINPFIK